MLTCSGYPRFIRGLYNNTLNFWVCTDLEEEKKQKRRRKRRRSRREEVFQETRQ